MNRERIVAFLLVALLVAPVLAGTPASLATLQVRFPNSQPIILGERLQNGFVRYRSEGIEQLTYRVKAILDQRYSQTSWWGKGKEAHAHHRAVFDLALNYGPSLLIPKALEEADLGLKMLIGPYRVSEPDRILRLYEGARRLGGNNLLHVLTYGLIYNDADGVTDPSNEANVIDTRFKFYSLESETFNRYWGLYKALYELRLFREMRIALREDWGRADTYKDLALLGNLYGAAALGVLSMQLGSAVSGYVTINRSAAIGKASTAILAPIISQGVYAGARTLASQIPSETIEQTQMRLGFEARLARRYGEYIKQVSILNRFITSHPSSALAAFLQRPEILALLLDSKNKYDLASLEMESMIIPVNGEVLEAALTRQWRLDSPSNQDLNQVVQAGLRSPLFRELAALTAERIPEVSFRELTPVGRAVHMGFRDSTGSIFLDERLRKQPSRAAGTLAHEMWHSLGIEKIKHRKYEYVSRKEMVWAITAAEAVAGLADLTVRQESRSPRNQIVHDFVENLTTIDLSAWGLTSKTDEYRERLYPIYRIVDQMEDPSYILN